MRTTKKRRNEFLLSLKYNSTAVFFCIVCRFIPFLRLCVSVCAVCGVRFVHLDSRCQQCSCPHYIKHALMDAEYAVFFLHLICFAIKIFARCIFVLILRRFFYGSIQINIIWLRLRDFCLFCVAFAVWIYQNFYYAIRKCDVYAQNNMIDCLEKNNIYLTKK